jgi:competence ComEA-like helix-hairpin-helix protein
MLNLAKQERQAVLFLTAVALLGVGISFFAKVNARVERFMHSDSHIAKLDINKAAYEDFLNAKAVSSSLAKKIIEYRSSHKEIASLEELKEIKGIGERRLKRLEEAFFVQ